MWEDGPSFQATAGKSLYDDNQPIMRIRKAVITAAARGQNQLPLQTLVDRDGSPKSALRIILEEATSSGIEAVCLIIRPGDQTAYSLAAGDLASRIYRSSSRIPAATAMPFFAHANLSGVIRFCIW